MGIENKNVFITGASGGLGLELAREFIKQGLNVFGTGTNLAKIELAKKNIDSDRFKIFQCKNSDSDKTLEILDRMNSVDIFISNAGSYIDGKVVDNSAYRIESVINTNLIGGIITTRLVLEKMQIQGRGVIVDINSNSTLISKPNMSIYTATKKGFDAFIQCSKLDYPLLKFVSVYPAGIQTNLHAASGRQHRDYFLFLDPKIVAKEITDNLLLNDSEIRLKQYFDRNRR